MEKHLESNMSVLLYYFCVFLFVSVAESSSYIPIDVEIFPEHRITVRSTPSLDPVEELLEKFGSDNQMNLTQMEELFSSIGVSGWNDTGTDGGKKKEQVLFFTKKNVHCIVKMV